jgi:hypothetical protein
MSPKWQPQSVAFSRLIGPRSTTCSDQIHLPRYSRGLLCADGADRDMADEYRGRFHG